MNILWYDFVVLLDFVEYFIVYGRLYLLLMFVIEEIIVLVIRFFFKKLVLGLGFFFM